MALHSYGPGDALDSAQYAANATHIYAANLCFSDDTNDRLAHALLQVGQHSLYNLNLSLSLTYMACSCWLLRRFLSE